MRSVRSAGGLIGPTALALVALAIVAAGGMAARCGTGWARVLWQRHPRGIVIHHSASCAVTGGRLVGVADIDRWHAHRGWGQSTATGEYHVGYHYVILADGTVQSGRPEWMAGAHTVGHNDCLGICLVGNFSSSAAGPAGRPTHKQLDSLVHLLVRLLRKHHLEVGDIHRHRDLARTACPGDQMPFEAVLARVKKALAT